MALDEVTRELVGKALAVYCRERVPPHARDRVRLGFEIRGNAVTLSESRPVFGDPSRWTEIPVAQFRFDPESGRWTLHCMDRNRRWHPYERIPAQRNFNVLLGEVEADPSGIFWG